MKTAQTLYTYLCLSILVVLLTSSSCLQTRTATVDDNKSSAIDLNASTEIVIGLLKLNALDSLFNETDHELLGLCVKNMSPADIALEVEALHHPGIVVLTYFKQSSQWDELKQALDVLAGQYPDITFVNIDSEQLFKLAEYAEIEQFPSILFLENRQELQRLEPVSLERLSPLIAGLAHKTSH